MRYALFLVLALAGCPPTPAPSPSPTPVPGPTPTPVVDGCCQKPDPTQGGWKQVATVDPYNALFLNEAEMRVGDVCGKPQNESIQDLIDQLADRGICSGPWNGGLLVRRPDGYWEQWTVVDPASGCWDVLSGSTYAGTWRGPALECGH